MSDQRLSITRRYSSPRRQVFDAWTRPPLLRRWAFGAFRKATKCVRMELYPGGRLELILRGCLNGSRRWGTFREVHAPHHLAFTWTSDGLGLGGQETRVTVDISGGDDGSTLTLVQEGLPDESTLETNRRAWEELLESLEGLLANP